MTFKELKNGDEFNVFNSMWFVKINENHVFSINLDEKDVRNALSSVVEKTITLDWQGIIKEAMRVKPTKPCAIFKVNINPDMNVIGDDYIKNNKEFLNYVSKFLTSEIIDLI